MELKKGYFITFEGADGCGKTTQIKLINQWLNENSIDTVLTLEPGDTELGKSLRQILLHYDKPVANAAETFLYLADRAQHVKYLIQPALKDKKVILCDRYTDSTVAYQGYGRGEDTERINYLNNIATEGLEPDLTLVFDVKSETAQKRVGKDKDRLESEGMDFHKKVRLGYLELAKKYPHRIKVIDANRGIEEVFSSTKEAIGELLNL